MREHGFTLIEILVVILIIGILSMIAVPVFLNQREKGAEASLESDVKNASLSMTQELVENKGKYPSSLPSYDKQGKDNRVFLVSNKSSEQSFCVKGTNPTYPKMSFSYSSKEGGLLPKGVECSDSAIEGNSNTVNMAGKKALLVTKTSQNDGAIAALKNAGIVNIDQIPEGTLTLTKANEYDLVFLVGAWWSPSGLDLDVANKYYEGGGHVFTDGNDMTSAYSPLIKTTVGRKSPANTGINVQLAPTYNTGLSPAFPYTFASSSFGSTDSWQCIKEVKPGAVVIADSVDPQVTSERCATMIAQTTGSGAWVHIIWTTGYETPDMNPTVAGIRWMLQ